MLSLEQKNRYCIIIAASRNLILAQAPAEKKNHTKFCDFFSVFSARARFNTGIKMAPLADWSAQRARANQRALAEKNHTTIFRICDFFSAGAWIR
mgnify:CR=1 FL=1